MMVTAPYLRPTPSPTLAAMAQTTAWRNFRRMQDMTVIAASLIYAAAVIHAFDRLPGPVALIGQVTLIWPALFLLLSLGLPLTVGGLRRTLARYVWMSFKAGFGQTVISVLGGVALLGGAAVFMYVQLAGAAHGGRYPAGAFAGYAAGIGILAAQAVLARALERTRDARREIETDG